MAEMFYDDDADLALIQSKKVAVLGYGTNVEPRVIARHLSQ